MKKISKKEASEKYGVIVTGVNSLYTYYLTDDGKVIDSDGDIRFIPPKTTINNYQIQKCKAIQRAIEWQTNFNCNYSYSELADYQTYFEKLAKRYGLIKEFKENGII